MNIHMTIDQQAERYRAAYENAARAQKQFKAYREKSKEARAQWIDATLELAVVMAEMRRDLPDHGAFSLWLQRNGLQYLSPNDRTALIGFGRDLPAARARLEATGAWSWRTIWEKKGASGTPIKVDKGTTSTPGRHLSGSDQRKRKREPVIPTVMRDDYVPGQIAARATAEPKRRRRSSIPAADPGPLSERRVPVLKGLTREQVDPDFKGDAHDFARTYGLVNLHTKQQIEHNKQQEVLMAWLGLVSDHERTARAVMAATVDPAILREWMGKPAKAAKLQAWCKNIHLAAENIRKIVEHEQPSVLVEGSAI